MSRKELNEEQASQIFDILKEICGANDYWRNNFIQEMCADCTEYRFSGSLGGGGKLRNNSNGIYVDCYQEDLNPERQQTIETVNVKLKEWEARLT